MFIIWGWGKMTRKVVCQVGLRMCNFCNQESEWQLCIVRTWFTIFFIPCIPYRKSYQISCPNCKSFFDLSKEEFDSLQNQNGLAGFDSAVPDSIKYKGKTETQINYLKEMENVERKN